MNDATNCSFDCAPVNCPELPALKFGFMGKRTAPPVYATAFSEYAVGRVLGQGGSGIVYEVTDNEGQHFALKVIDADKATPRRLKRFQNEIMFSLRNRHDNIITVVDHGRSEAGPFYVMPLYGCTLEKVMAQGMAHNDVLPVFSQILDGMDAAHLQAVVHRDLKPKNILCDSAKNKFVVADFGIASFEEDELRDARRREARQFPICRPGAEGQGPAGDIPRRYLCARPDSEPDVHGRNPAGSRLQDHRRGRPILYRQLA